MAMGPLKRKKALVGRVRVSKWGWSMDMGPCKGRRVWLGRSGCRSGDGRWPCGSCKRKKTLVGRVRVSKWGWSMGMSPLKRKKILIGRVRVSK